MSHVRRYDILLIALGAILFALVLNMLIIPHEFGQGGITGLTLLLYYTFGLETSISGFLLNGLLVLLAYRFLSKVTVIYTFFAIGSMSLVLHATTFLQDQWLPVVPSALLAGIGTGLSMALVLSGNGSTAGSDIIALLCHKYFRLPIARVILLVDVCVVTPLFFRIGLEKTVWTLVMVAIASQSLAAFLKLLKPNPS